MIGLESQDALMLDGGKPSSDEGQLYKMRGCGTVEKMDARSEGMTALSQESLEAARQTRQA